MRPLPVFPVFLLSALLLLLCCNAAPAQPGGHPDHWRMDTMHISRTGDSIGTAGERPWYDTLTVTKPRYARASRLEQVALSVFTALSVPVGITFGLTSLLPPSITVLREDGVNHVGIAVSSGMGFGGDTSQAMFFPDARLQVEVAYFFTRSPQPMVRTGLLFDAPIGSIHNRDFVWFGVAGGGGVSTDFESVSPYAEGWIGTLNPLGIPFITLFPMHNYGLRGRVGYNIMTGAPWYELSLSATSTFW